MDVTSTFPNLLIETDLLRTFVAIAETGSFTKAAGQIHRTPSAVSMQIKKLEEILGRELFLRESRSVAMTPDGEILLGYARRILRINQEAVSRFLSPPIEGVVSFGAPDDFGTRFAPNILARFAATHCHVEVNVVLSTSVDLTNKIEDGTLDLTLITASGRMPAPNHGELVFHEPLKWAGLDGGMAHESDPLPLALSGDNCAWRTMALAALDKSHRPYRIAYSSESWAGQQAALVADLAIAPIPCSLIVPPLRMIGRAEGLPELGNYQIVMLRGMRNSPALEALAQHVVQSFADMQAASPKLVHPT